MLNSLACLPFSFNLRHPLTNGQINCDYRECVLASSTRMDLDRSRCITSHEAAERAAHERHLTVCVRDFRPSRRPDLAV
jgi:hypothetical protein